MKNTTKMKINNKDANLIILRFQINFLRNKSYIIESQLFLCDIRLCITFVNKKKIKRNK